MELNDNTPLDQAVKSNRRFLAQEDAGEEGLILTIKSFSIETLTSDDKGEEQKTIVHWVEAQKPMVLGKLTMTQLGYASGASKLGEAKGKQVLVYRDPTVMMGPRMTGGLRIKKVPAATAAPQRQTAYTSAKTKDPDEIPF